MTFPSQTFLRLSPLVLALGLGGCVASYGPLARAAAEGDNQAVRDLIEAGAALSPHDCTSEPLGFPCDKPLIHAARNGHLETVKLLLKAGATPYDIDNDSKSARERAEENGFTEIAKVLKQAEELDRAQEEGFAGVTAAEAEKIVQAALDAAEGAKSPPIVSDADKPSYRKAEDPDAVAVVLGVEKYADLPAADFAERDATAVRDHLLALGVPRRNIVFAVDQQVTKTGIMKYIEAWLPKRVTERSTVFVYFAGHGAPDFRTGKAFLVPSDGDPKYLRLSGYPLARLYEKVAGLKAKRVVVALDSCFSGAGGRSVLAKGTRPLVTTVDLGISADGRIVSMSAAGADQVSGTLRDQGHGAFTYYLLKGLNGEAGSGGSVTVKALYDYLVPRVQDAARRENRAQTPLLFPAGGGAPLELR
ncbi:MAG: caspase family protein [Elusimicrobia bacterium]|nr:caspase family protein [Elusimicrobiota bacterium]